MDGVMGYGFYYYISDIWGLSSYYQEIVEKRNEVMGHKEV